MGTCVLGKARLVTLEGDAVGALAEVDSAVMLLSDLQNVVAHWNRLPACAARAGVAHFTWSRDRQLVSVPRGSLASRVLVTLPLS